MYTQGDYWERTYGEGQQLNRAPFDQVVSFLYYAMPRNKPKNEIQILELGCGAGNNLWFAAREGFSVTGIDISRSAIDYAKKRFDEDGLRGDFFVGEFSSVSSLNKKFDLVIERGALCCIPFEQAKSVISLLPQIMMPGARMLFCPYSDKHSWCASGTYTENGMINTARSGYLYFYSRREIIELFEKDFVIKSLVHVEETEMLTEKYSTHAEWIVIVENACNK